MSDTALKEDPIDLGPRWSSEEIHLFFDSKISYDFTGWLTHCIVAFKKKGKDW